MLYVLWLIVELNAFDDVMSVQIMYLGMLHGLLPTVSLRDAGECTNESRRFFGPAGSCHREGLDGFFAPI